MSGACANTRPVSNVAHRSRVARGAARVHGCARGAACPAFAFDVAAMGARRWRALRPLRSCGAFAADALVLEPGRDLRAGVNAASARHLDAACPEGAAI